MYKEIYKKIKKYNTIVITRHIGADPDALGAQMALKDIIKTTFPEKKVYVVGAYSSKFKFIGIMDKPVESMYTNSLVIVLDTPIKKRIDIDGYGRFEDSIKIDHHPFEEDICNLEWINDNASSTCEMIIELCNNTKLKLTKRAAGNLFVGIIADTNRFLNYCSTPYTMKLTADLIEKYELDTNELYEELYLKDMSEMRLQGYISQNMIITDNNVGYICITDEIIKEYGVDAASAGNMINNFMYINELLVWVTFSEDVKQNIIRVSIRSRGPIVNETANEFNGGGHKYASGIRIESFDRVDEIIGRLDALCKEYKESQEK